MEPFTVHLFLLSGRSGAGKSTIAYEVCHQLSSPMLDIPHIHIEGDGLDFIHPAGTRGSEPSMMLMNLHSVFRNYYQYRRASCSVVLISGTGMILQWDRIKIVVEKACEEVRGNDASMPRARVCVCGIILRASDETVEARLRQREIGTDLQRHLESSRKMAGVLDREFGEGVETSLPVSRFNTDIGTVSDIAAGIVEHILGSKT